VRHVWQAGVTPVIGQSLVRRNAERAQGAGRQIRMLAGGDPLNDGAAFGQGLTHGRQFNDFRPRAGDNPNTHRSSPSHADDANRTPCKWGCHTLWTAECECPVRSIRCSGKTLLTVL